MTLRVGVIGCGSIGRRYAGWLADLGCAVAAYDQNPTQLAGFSGTTTRICASLTEIITWASDALVIATPPRHHHAPLMAALGGGARILVEKPLSASLAEGEAMATAAARSPGRVFGVCNMRFHPAVQALRAAIPAVGQPLYARSHFAHRLAQMRPAGLAVFAADAAEGGGVILDCVHDLDLLQWFFGPLQVVQTRMGRIGPDPIGAEDYARLHLLSAAGVEITVDLDFVARWKRRGCEIVGTEATTFWASEGRRPEVATVSLNRMDAPETVFASSGVDSAHEYLAMLRAFLSGGEGLQTLGEAYDLLKLAKACGAPVQ